jgi:hypothetical protein
VSGELKSRMNEACKKKKCKQDKKPFVGCFLSENGGKNRAFAWARWRIVKKWQRESGAGPPLALSPSRERASNPSL